MTQKRLETSVTEFLADTGCQRTVLSVSAARIRAKYGQ